MPPGSLPTAGQSVEGFCAAAGPLNDSIAATAKGIVPLIRLSFFTRPTLFTLLPFRCAWWLDRLTQGELRTPNSERRTPNLELRTEPEHEQRSENAEA